MFYYVYLKTKFFKQKIIKTQNTFYQTKLFILTLNFDLVAYLKKNKFNG